PLRERGAGLLPVPAQGHEGLGRTAGAIGRNKSPHGAVESSGALLLQGTRSMNKDEIKGAANKAKGAVKEAAGKMAGNDRMVVEGKMDKAKGSVQKGVGKAKDAMRKH